MKEKHLYTWNWVDGGYNQCWAYSKEEALQKGNAMCSLVVDEKTLRLVADERAFWAGYPSNN
jgi:hypothetical protein